MLVITAIFGNCQQTKLCLVPGAWYLVQVPSTRCLVPGTRHLTPYSCQSCKTLFPRSRGSRKKKCPGELQMKSRVLVYSLKDAVGKCDACQCNTRTINTSYMRFNVKHCATVGPGHLLVNLGFWIFIFSDVRLSRLLFCKKHFWKSGGEISRKNNNGVLDRPWTKRRVLRAISSTLKFQFTVNPES